MAGRSTALSADGRVYNPGSSQAALVAVIGHWDRSHVLANSRVAGQRYRDIVSYNETAPAVVASPCPSDAPVATANPRLCGKLTVWPGAKRPDHLAAGGMVAIRVVVSIGLGV